MALDGDRLGIAMAAAAEAVYSTVDNTTPISQSKLNDLWSAAGNAIVDEFVANGITTTNVTTGSSAGTYPGTIS